MNLPELNPGGYVNASISNVTGFHKVDYLLAHGSGDDNVHYANSAHLLDMFTKAQVRGFRFRMFTDRSVVGCYNDGWCKKSVDADNKILVTIVSVDVGHRGRYTSI